MTFARRILIAVLFIGPVFIMALYQPASAQDKAVGVEPVEAAKQLGSNRRALIIGINDYADERIKDLAFAEDDAGSLFKTLTDPRIGGFAKEQVTLLTGRQASTKDIRKALYALRTSGKDDLVVIFFSGHGAKQAGETFWISQDAELADLGPTALPNAEIQRLLAAIPSERVVTLLDCCYAADTVLNQKSVLNVGDVAKLFAGKGRVTIAGAGGGEEAIEVPGMKQGVFTHFLVGGLRGQADANRDGVVTLMELWAWLEPNVEQSARQHKGIQKPTMHMETGQQTDRFLLSLNPVAAADVQQALAKLRQLFLEEKIAAAHYEEGRELIGGVVADPAKKKRREIYLDLAKGKLDAKYLASALSSNSEVRERAPTRPSAEVPTETDGELGKIDHTQSNQGATPSLEEALRAGAPGEHHKNLGKFVGRWDVKSKFFLNPDAPPIIGKYQSEGKWTLGNRYVTIVDVGRMMEQEYENQTTLGYDNLKKEYTMETRDNMSTTTYRFTGRCSSDGSAFDFNGSTNNAITGELEKYRFKTTFQDADHYSVEGWILTNGSEQKLLELNYTRKK
ncbi:Caspase domain protein [Phycisphaerae bacterium RAS2]|nr:Caspase domain protein [Phycisphaerae bacterium RAS2]